MMNLPNKSDNSAHSLFLDELGMTSHSFFLFTSQEMNEGCATVFQK